MNILQTIGAGIASLGIFIGGLFGFTPENDPIAYAPEEEALGADTVLPTGIQTYTLAGTGISSTASSFTLTSLTLPQNGYAIQDSDMSDTFYITFEPGSRSRQEFVSCTTIGTNTGGKVTISGCTRGLSPLTPYTASTSLRFAHSGGTSVIFSNAPQLYNEYTAKGNDETITGQWTFTNFPITASTSIASATTSGIVELATGAEAASSTLSGDIATSKLALSTAIATSAAPTSGNVVVVTGDDGNIDYGFLPDLYGSTTIRTYNATSTWTKQANLKRIEIWVCGSGGNGGAGTAGSESGAGGGAGGCGFEILDAGELAATSSVQIIASLSPSGTSKFSTFCSATSGTNANAKTRGAGGSATGCDLNIPGAGGTGGSGPGGDIAGSPGGGSALAPGGGGGTTNTGVGDNGYYGSGAGGGAGSAGSGFGTGGTGGEGVVIVTEYY